MPDNAKLIIRRGVLKGELTRTIHFTKVNTEDINIEVIKARRDKCEDVWREFEQTQLEIKEGALEGHKYEWEMEAPKTSVASIELLKTFLQKRYQILEAVESTMQINVRPQSTASKKGNNNNNQNKMRAMTSNFASEDIKCFVCKQSHTMYKYPTFLDMTVPQWV
ncbi:hypothetical protein QTP88_007736 [Uroleucon formosanum]